MKRISRLGRAAIVVMGMVAVLAFLPSLFGRVVLSRAQNMVARHLYSSLQADSCSLGWFEGLRCEQVRYQDPERGVRFEIPRLTSDKGVLRLLAAPSYLGDITVEQPVLTFIPPPSASGEPSDTDSDNGEGRQRFPSSPWWERLTFRFKMTGGQLVIEHGDDPPRQFARQVELGGSLAMGSVHYDLSFLASQQSGRFRAAGFINLPLADQPLPEMLVASANVTIADLEIADFLELAASRSQVVPNGRGILNATLRLNIAGIREFEARGETSLRDVQLSGGILGEDRPSLEALDFRFAGGFRQDKGWRLDTLELHSAPVRLSAKGGFNAGTGNLSATGKVHLPVLAAQVPRLLKVHEQTVITEGSVDFSLEAAGSGQAVTIRTDCRTEQLSLIHGGHHHSWTLPLALVAEADYGDGTMSVRSLRVQTPFFEAQGSSDLNGFSLQGSGDLDRMSQELRTIFDLGVQTKGHIELAATVGKTDGKGIGCEGSILIRDFAWIRGEKVPLPSHDMRISAQAVVGPLFLQNRTFDSLQVEISARPGRLFLRAEDMGQHREDVEENCVVQGNVDLERLSEVVQNLRDDTLFPALQGTLRFDGKGFCAAGARMTLRNLQGTVEQLAIIGPGYDIREAEAGFALGETGRHPGRQVWLRELAVLANEQDLNPLRETPFFQVDAVQRRLAVQGLGWTSAGTNVTVSGTMEDWQRPRDGFSVSLKGETSAVLLGEIAGSIGWLPADMSLAGKARGALTVNVGADRNSSAEVTLDFTSFSLLRGQKQLFADPHLVVHFVLDKENRPGGIAKISSLFLNSTPLNIEGAGSIAATVPPMLEMQGRMVCNYAALLSMLPSLVSRDISMSGSQAADILLSLPLQWPVPMERLTFSAQLPVDSFSLQGFGFKSLTVPVDYNLGKLRCRLDGPLEGGGRVSLEPVWDFAAPMTTLSLPAEGQLVQDAAFKPALVRLLGRLHPLFGPVAQPQGVINMRPSVFFLPLADKGTQWPAFTMALSMDRAKFRPTGALQELLLLAGFPQEWLSCKEKEMICEGKKGRVHCGPVHLLAGDHEIGLQGDMLPDGSLRYRVHLPMSQHLAEKIQLSMQGRIMVEAEIKGDREQPVFDAEAFLAGLPAQLHQGVEADPADSGRSADPADKEKVQAEPQNSETKE